MTQNEAKRINLTPISVYLFDASLLLNDRFLGIFHIKASFFAVAFSCFIRIGNWHLQQDTYFLVLEGACECSYWLHIAKIGSYI